jgi:hypothetical protein
VLAWHLAGALFLFRWIFRDPEVDVRYLAAGALLPDVVDLPLGTLFLVDRYSTGELFMHTLTAPAAVGVVVLVLTRRGARRKAWMALAVGMLFHLFLDGMWREAEVFAWPFFGFDFPPGPDPYWSGVGDRALADPWRWGREVVGLAYLAALWSRSGLRDRLRRRDLVRTGRLAP